MKSTAALIAAAAGVALLSGCSITYQTHSSMESAADKAMAICGLGIIQTADGPRPAISESPMSTEAYQTYTDCVQRLTHEEKDGDGKTESASESGAKTIQSKQGPSK
jgi:hypothetical protein